MNVENYLNLDTWKVYTPCLRRIDMYTCVQWYVFKLSVSV